MVEGAEIEPPTCPPHKWEERKRQTVERTKEKKAAEVEHLRTKPSKVHQASGPEFEVQAIDANRDKLEIEATSVEYKCSLCSLDQEVDILGKEKLAEAKSRNKKGWKNVRDQHKNYVEIQQQVFDRGRPLAKADGGKLSRNDKNWFRNKLDSRGFDTEIL